MADMNDMNDSFGIPGADGAKQSESLEARETRLRAKAREIVATESDEEVLKRLIAEERQARNAKGIPTDTQGFPADYDKVHVFKGQQKHDLEYVPLGINGFVIKVPRGEDVIIPSCFTKILECAVEEVTIKSQGGLVTRPAHTFPYTVKGKATDAEYQAYRDGQKAKAAQQSAQAA